MDCEKSIEMLSDFHDDELDERGRLEVTAHLAKCRPCAGLYSDLDNIIAAASILGVNQTISYPSEEAMWRRLGLEGGEIH